MGVEDIMIHIGKDLFSENIISFLIIYTFLGLLVITLKYSILGNENKNNIWRKQDPLSKTVYGFVVGISSWVGALPFTFLFYYLWSKVETAPNIEILIGLPILLISVIYGSIVLGNKYTKEKIKPVAIMVFCYYSISFTLIVFLFSVVVQKITNLEYTSGIILLIISILLLLPFFYKKKMIKEIVHYFEER